MEYRRPKNNWECGVTAVHNALITWGIEADRQSIKIHTGCTRFSGTSARGIIRGAAYYGCKGTKYQTKNPDHAWRWILKWASRAPCIMLLDEWEHWAVVSGSVANKVILIDADRSTPDVSGASPLTKQELLSRWVGRGAYYAIRITKD